MTHTFQIQISRGLYLFCKKEKTSLNRPRECEFRCVTKSYFTVRQNGKNVIQ